MIISTSLNIKSYILLSWIWLSYFPFYIYKYIFQMNSLKNLAILEENQLESYLLLVSLKKKLNTSC